MCGILGIARNFLKRRRNTAKKQWKKCKSCSIITDTDEDNCPQRGISDNPGHTLIIVQLNDEEIRMIYGKGNVWTKRVADLIDRLSQ